MTAARRPIVAVTSELPWPLNSGGHIRTFHLLSAIAAVADVTLMLPGDRVSAALIAPLVARGVGVVPISVGPRTVTGEARRVVRSLVAGEPYAMYGRHGWPAVLAALEGRVRDAPPALLYLDHIDSYWYAERLRARGVPLPPVVVDMHNVYSRLLERTADERSWPTRQILRRDARRMAIVERHAAAGSAAILAVSAQEAADFAALGANAAHLVPNGVDASALASLPVGRSGPPVVMFLGTMSWGPNAAGVRYLIDAMARVRERVPDATLVIVGRDVPADIAARHGEDGIEIAGGVPDVRPFLERASVLAVPLDAGGGTRLKILEAFAAGLPVVSTAIGMEGIDADAGRHYALAERGVFVDALVRILSDRRAATAMASAARELATTYYDWRDIGRRAAAVVVELCEIANQ